MCVCVCMYVCIHVCMYVYNFAPLRQILVFSALISYRDSVGICLIVLSQEHSDLGSPKYV